MKFLVLLAFALIKPSFSHASEKPCENRAKYEAIRAYKSQIGDIQGSLGIEYFSDLINARGDLYNYNISIFDNNEDGETWQIDYSVAVRAQGSFCRIVSVKRAN